MATSGGSRVCTRVYEIIEGFWSFPQERQGRARLQDIHFSFIHRLLFQSPNQGHTGGCLTALITGMALVSTIGSSTTLLLLDSLESRNLSLSKDKFHE